MKKMPHNMNLNPSEHLIIKKIYTTNSMVLAIYPDKNQRIRLDKLKLSCDFDILTAKESENGIDFMINLNIRCNEEEKPGYFFDIGVVGEFTLRNTDKPAVQKQYMLYTATPMVINSARVFIQNITSMCEFGPYLMPSIDLIKLIKDKEDNSH